MTKYAILLIICHYCFNNTILATNSAYFNTIISTPCVPNFLIAGCILRDFKQPRIYQIITQIKE